jgi:RND family efflux transporter MFP subunit
MTMSTLWAHARRTPARLAVATALMAAAISSCGGNAAPASGTTTPAAAAAAGPVTIEVARVVQQPLDLQLSLPGELTAYQTVAIHPRVSGFVKAVAVDRGSRVRAGQVLATLEAPELVAHRAEADSKLREAEAQLSAVQARADADAGTFDRLKAASSTPGVVAGNDVLVAHKAADAGRSQVAAAQQGVEAARQALAAVRDMEGYLRVAAPFAGVITERNIHPGALVGPSGGTGAATPMLRLVDDRRLRLVVPVPEAYTADIKTGGAIAFTLAAYPGEAFTGTVARVARSVDVSTRTMAVELDVANAEGRLAPGTFCQVRWPVRRSAPSRFVPSTSIASTTDRTFVIRIRGGRTEWVDVRTGLTAGPLVEIFGAVDTGDEVARRGTDELRPGTPVRVREAKPAA